MKERDGAFAVGHYGQFAESRTMNRKARPHGGLDQYIAGRCVLERTEERDNVPARAFHEDGRGPASGARTGIGGGQPRPPQKQHSTSASEVGRSALQHAYEALTEFLRLEIV